jgi:hypothetical protein
VVRTLRFLELSLRTRSLLIATALSSLIALAGVPGVSFGQTFVYDTRTAMGTLEGGWDDEVYDFVGGRATLGEGGIDHDSQAADAFVLTNRARLTRITIDTIELQSGAGMPSGGFLVEIFPNTAGDHPAEIPTFSLVVPPTSCTFDGLFTNSTATSVWGLTAASLQGDRATWSVSLLGSNILLDAGTWWISVMPKNDGDPFGSEFRWVGTNAAMGIARTHYRCGGVDHSNNYACAVYATGQIPHPNWSVDPELSAAGVPGTLSLRIEGDVQSDTCHADFNSSGSITVQDIFDFLSAWFAGLPSADFNGTGGITVQDIFDFLTAWFTGC